MTVSSEPQPQRRGCCCVLFITEDGGTQRGSRARCLAHKRTARENYVGD